ncbi:S-adenosyl-L-methionine-dependent methyltransferase [Trichophaea hybrida]|nr:S-adenosyl-L-methionine-dependent methyltransferase [Trichophaea hybrida]
MAGSSFTSEHRYGKQGEVYHDDGREQDLLKHIFSLPPRELSKLRNNSKAILSTIDKFATSKYLMNIGEMKGLHIVNQISTVRPKICLELGGYIGYSTILFGSAVKEAAGGNNAAKYYCLEHNPVFAAIIMALVDLAGLSDVVKVVIGPSTESISRLAEEGVLKDGVDFMFLDHLKPLYTPDLKLCESLGLIKVGTVLAADNMVKPGNPPYHKYVNMSPSEKAVEAEGKKGAERGDPTLRYENEWIESWEPQAVRDALEISKIFDGV